MIAGIVTITVICVFLLLVVMYRYKNRYGSTIAHKPAANNNNNTNHDNNIQSNLDSNGKASNNIKMNGKKPHKMKTDKEYYV